MKVLALDPGPEQTAFVIWDGSAVIDKGIVENKMVFAEVKNHRFIDACAIEMIACYGMAVGKETFETCVWIGRFMEKWRDYAGMGDPLRIVRLDIKMHLCHSPQAKDANVRQALIDRIAAHHGLSEKEVIGKKKTPGPLYGVASHVWAALAVAVTAHDRLISGFDSESIRV